MAPPVNMKNELKNIETGDRMFDLLNEDHFLLDSIVSRVDIYQLNYRLVVDIYFRLMHGKEKSLMLRFGKVSEYQFYYSSNSTFYNVESFKLLKSDSLFYLSLDPDESNPSILSSDQDIVLSETLEGYAY